MNLSFRKAEAVRMAAEHGNARAADLMGISIQTLKNTLTRAYLDLGVFTIAEALKALDGEQVVIEDPVARVKALSRNRDAKAVPTTYRCGHCAFTTTRLSHAWVHGYGHGYRGAVAP